MNKSLAIFCFIVFSALNGSSQSIKIKHNQYVHYTTDQGLPQAFVSKILQDEDGFIWIATMNGVARFDGKNFKTFNSNSPEGQKLTSNQVNDIYLDDHRKLWLLLPSGVLNVIDTRTLAINKNPKPYLTAAIDRFPLKFDYGKTLSFLDGGEGYWFAAKDDQFLLFDSTKSELVKVFEKKHKKKYKRIYSYQPHPKGGFYVLSDDGFFHLNGKLESYEKLDAQVKLFHTLNPKKNILLGDGSIFYDSEYFFGRYYPESGKSEVLDFSHLGIPHVKFYHIYTSDNRGGVIIRIGDYLIRYTVEGKSEILWRYPGRSDLRVNALLVDKTDVLWVGTNSNGLFKIDLNKGAIQSREYEYNFLVNLLLHEFQIPLANIPKNWLQNQFSYGFRYAYTQTGKLLITQEAYGFGDQRIVYLLENRELVKVNLKNIYQKDIGGISSQNSTVWAVDLNMNLFSWKEHELSEQPDSIKLIENYSRDKPKVLDLLTDEHYHWILLKNNTLLKVEEGSVIKKFDLSGISSGFIDLHQDKDSADIIWIGGLTGGLVKWDKSKEQAIKRFTIEEGLSNDNVTGILEDSIGNLWISTFNGLNRFNKSTERFSNFGLKDGLRESEFNRHHIFEFKDGRMAFGGINSLIILNPYDFKIDQHNPETEIVGLKINEETVDYISDSSLVSQTFSELDELKLEYFQNNLMLDIASTQYNDLEKSKARYQLKNYNSSWIPLEDQSSFRLYNIPPGNYELLLNASNSDGLWSNKIKKLEIKILPPPWLSWWAFLIYGLLIISTFALTWKSYKKRLIRNQTFIFNQKEAERLKEMDEMKTRFFSNITHEFRTPLTLILTPLERFLKKERPSGKVEKLLTSNYRNASQLLKLVNQLLDINKIESGKMQNNLSLGNPQDFVASLVADFQIAAKSKNIQLEFTSKADGHFFFEQNHLERILYNLLGNAIKFTESKGKVRVSLVIEKRGNVEEWKAIINVKDNGIGIPDAAKDDLFDRFYQVDDSFTRQYEGTGIGLALVKELTELINGSLSFESTLGEGSSFTVEFPVVKASEDELKHDLATEKKTVTTEAEEHSHLILVVDDNEELLSFIGESLAENHQVITALDGNTAWSIVQEKMPDILITDVMMPGKNGYELSRLIRENPVTAHIQIIMLSAKSAQQAKEEGLLAGANTYLTKPFHFSELELIIANLVSQRINLQNYLFNKSFPKSLDEVSKQIEEPFLVKLNQFLDSHFQDINLSIERLSEELGVSRSTLNRKLKAILNISPNEYVRQYRLKRSIDFLNTEISIAEVAYKVGFESPSYFSLCFKEFYKVSPSEYHRQSS